MAAYVSDWMLWGLVLPAAIVSIAAGVLAAAVAVRAAWHLLVWASGDLIAWRDLREAVDEWRDRHPDKAERYRDGSGPWRTW